MRYLLCTIGILAVAVTFTPVSTSAAGTWQPAIVSTASALGDSKGFTIVARVELSQVKSCYDVEISRLLTFLPPTHYVVRYRRNDTICTTVMLPTSYTARQHFAAHPWPRSVNLYALDIHHQPKHWVLPVIIEQK